MLRVLAVVAVLSLAALFALGRVRPHRVAPTPEGLVLRLELPSLEGLSPIRRVHAYLAIRPGPESSTVVVEFARTVGQTPSGSWTTTLYRRLVVRWPDGAVLEDGPADRRPEWATEVPVLDLDGDGQPDRVLAGLGDDLPRGTVRVLSGADGSVLFEHREDLHLEADDRAFPLGDLDGDGFGELALVHPRLPRDDGPEGLVADLLGVSSWVTVVSGAELFGPQRR